MSGSRRGANAAEPMPRSQCRGANAAEPMPRSQCRGANAAEPMLTWGVLPARPRVACGLDMRHRMIHRFVPGNHPEERLRPCEEPEGCDDYHVAHVTITLGWVHVG